MLSRTRSLWRNLVHRRTVERDLDEEVRGLHALLTEEKIRSGMSPDAARRAATIELGQIDIVKQHVRDARAGAFLDTTTQDLRHGLRLLGRSPLFACTAVLSLGVGIGANATVFSLVNALMLRDLRVPNAHQLVEVWRTTPNGPGTSFSYPMYEVLRDQTPVCSGVLAMSRSTVTATVEGADRPPAGRYVSGNFFEVLGVAPQLGRLLSARDDRPEAAAVAVISHGLWQRRFGGSAAALDELVRVDDVSFRIVGVLAPAFDDPLVGHPADFFVPIAAEPQLRRPSLLGNPFSNWLAVVGRLQHGTSIEAASANMATVFSRFVEDLASTIPDAHSRQRLRTHHLFLTSARTGLSDLRRDYSTPALLLMGAVALVLLIACGNVATLLLARGVARRREVALRLAIGASRRRLVRQLLTESTLLGVLGGAVGLAVAAVGAPVLLALVPRGSDPIALDVSPDTRTVFVTFGAAVSSAVLAGLFPAIRGARMACTLSDQGDVRTLRMTRSSTRWGRGLIAVQVALSLLLVVGATLLAATLRNLRTLDPGFDREHVVLLHLDAPKAGYADDRLEAYYRQVLEHVRALPAVEAAALSMITPLSGAGIDLPLGVEREPDESAAMVYVNRVSDGFFAAMAMPLLLGRDFAPADRAGGSAGAVINESLARRYFQARNPLGRRIVLGRQGPLEIIGVVADAKYLSLRERDKPTVYVYSAGAPERGLTLSVRTSGDPAAFAEAIRRAAQSVAPAVPISPPRTLASQVERSVGTERLVARLLGAFAVLALILAAGGLYGVLSYFVAQRTGEIGVRLALGATRARVLRSVLAQSWAVVALGSAVGVPGAILLSRAISSLVFDVSAWDPRVLGAAVCTLFAVATAAAALPAWRASRVDPIVALRHE